MHLYKALYCQYKPESWRVCLIKAKSYFEAERIARDEKYQIPGYTLNGVYFVEEKQLHRDQFLELTII